MDMKNEIIPLKFKKKKIRQLMHLRAYWGEKLRMKRFGLSHSQMDALFWAN